jgi:hypothetical protein
MGANFGKSGSVVGTEDADADDDDAGCGSSPAACANGEAAATNALIAPVRIALGFTISSND